MTTMPSSTEPSPDEAPTTAEREFAARVLQDLLHRIEVRNANAAVYPGPGRCRFLVSHAWTDGSSIRLVYVTPPSDRTWGLARDTRTSLISPGPWDGADDPALYYYLLDLEEDWPGAESREPGEDDDLIWWRGYPVTHLPGRLSELPTGYRCTPPPSDPAWIDHRRPPVTEPRRYADPNGPLPPH
jgi:hypothetical protein